MSQEFKEALAAWASGVAVVATRVNDVVYGLTVSSFTSLSLDPPLVLTCIAVKSRLPPLVRESRRFAISILSAEQDAASSALARSGREAAPTLGVPEASTASGMPVVADAMAYLDCDLHSELPVGDHVILVGHVVEAVSNGDRAPLLYHRRGYRTLGSR